MELLPTNKIRGLVSKKKRRFQKDGFDLDLSYITDKIVAMGFPSEKLEGIYRNPMGEVRRFLEELHGEHYQVYNLCSERRYDHKKFNGRVREYPFDDHNPCPLALIQQFCFDVDKWLDADPRNIAVIHCKAGKGRTGMMICCYLQHSKRCQSASEALQLFAAKRTHNAKGVTLHSQRRYVHYYESTILQSKQLPPTVYIRLERIRMHTIPTISKGGSEPWFSIAAAGNTIYYSDPVKGKRGNQVVDFACGALISNDIKIEFYHKNLKGKLFYFWFHCSFVKNNYFCLRKRDLEQASKDVACKHFSQGFKVELFFQSEDTTRNTVSIPKAQKPCKKCKKSVSSVQPSMMVGEDLYHWECIECDRCGKSLAGSKNCVIKDNKPVCESCEGDQFFTPCSSCFRPLVGQRIIEINSLAWHPDCFRCGYCSKLFNHKHENEYIMEQNTPYCPDHRGMHKRVELCYWPECQAKNRPDNMISALGHQFHDTCFRCVDCGRQLNHKEDRYLEKEGFPCCESHSEPVHCFSCQKEVSPDQSFTAFKEVWHRDCLVCSETSCCKQYSSTDSIEEVAEIKQGKLICREHQLKCCCICKQRVPDSELLQIHERDYHKSCFTCSICSTVIEDPVSNPSSYLYDEKKQLPSCMKHQQHCTRCKKPIEGNKGLQVKPGQYWHPNCFTCQMPQCLKPLSLQEYVVISGKNYCTTHPVCTRCTKPIEMDDLYEDHNGCFHKNCYRCGKCNTQIDPENSAFLGNRLLCKPCHPAPVCTRCDRILDRGHLAVGTHNFHNDCYRCMECDELIPSVKDPVTIDQRGLPVCQACSDSKLTRCDQCKLPVRDRVIEALGKQYHVECFQCEYCLCGLTTSFALLDDHIFCRACAQQVQTLTCQVCSNTLIGSYLISPGVHVHTDCATCASCHQASSSYIKHEQEFYCPSCVPASQVPEPTPVTRAAPSISNGSHRGRGGINRGGGQPARMPSASAVNNASRQPQAQPPPTVVTVDDHPEANKGPLERSSSFAKPIVPSGRLDRSMSFADHRASSAAASTHNQPANNAPRNSTLSNITSANGNIDKEGPPNRGTVINNYIDDKIKMSGYLKKQGGVVKNWKRRWFVLTGSKLAYRVGPSESVLGEIQLDNTCKLLMDEEKGIIELDTTNPPRQWKFVCEDAAALPKWYKHLLAVISS